MYAQRIIKIGTRDSKLALWQAEKVKALLSKLGLESELIPVKSKGDLDLATPLYAMGVQGVFTKALDAYLLSEKIDIAVHSMKDVPTQLAEGTIQGAVLKRGDYQDVIVWRDKAYSHEELKSINGTIGTGSIRRSSQWKNRFPNHEIENLRGNVQTRLRKLKESQWIGAIFAKAGLERMGLLPENHEVLDWMYPAPAQGAIMVACRAEDNNMQEILKQINHDITCICVNHERDFLSGLKGGCSAPIGAICKVKGDSLLFDGCVCRVDGSDLLEINLSRNLQDNSIGKRAAKILIDRGADKIVEEIRNAKL